MGISEGHFRTLKTTIMSLQRKFALFILTLVCIAVTGYLFEYLTINSSSSFTPNVLEDGENILGGSWDVLNTGYSDLTPAFIPIRLISASFAVLCILLAAFTYSTYVRFLRKYNILMYMPLPIMAISTVIIYQSNPTVSWQILLGVSLVCLFAFILLATDKVKIQSDN